MVKFPHTERQPPDFHCNSASQIRLWENPCNGNVTNIYSILTLPTTRHHKNMQRSHNPQLQTI